MMAQVQQDVAQVDDPRAQRSREAILRAAVDLIAEGGIRAASAQAVSRRAGVNRATVYRHWPQLGDLHGAALVAMLHSVEPPDTGDLRTDLENVAVGLARSLQTSPWRVLLPCLIGDGATDPRIADLHGQFIRDRREIGAKIIERAKQRGQLTPETDAAAVLEAVVGPIYYRVLLTREAISDDDARTIARCAARAHMTK